MQKLILNHAIAGFTTVEIDNDTLTRLDSEDLVVLVLDNSTNKALSQYYDLVIRAITVGAKLITIVIAKESEIRKPICNLMALYHNYNIYKVDSKDTVTTEYVEELVVRKPTFVEIQSFIGGDVAAYSDINTILLGIDDLVSHGDLDGLKVFIEQHINSIEGLTSTIDYMRRVVDSSNSSELETLAGELQKKLDEATFKMKQLETSEAKLKEDNQKLQESTRLLREQLASAAAQPDRQPESSGSGLPVISSYSAIRTNVIKCNVQHILYFKEISQIPYINSMVMALCSLLRGSGKSKKHVKLLIYDTNVSFNTYKNLQAVSGSSFVTNKNTLITKTESFVVVEPNPAILTETIQCVNPEIPILIIYDRLRKEESIIEGNNVTKFFVINSSNDYLEASKKMSMNKQFIITRTGSTIGPECLNIPTIPNYTDKETTPSARVAKYLKLQAEGNKKLVIQTILDAARINIGRR